jgi:hypothetical protein
VALNERTARGFVLFVIALIVLIAGYVGYVQYEELIEPNLPVFVCCVPSALIAAVLLFFAFARRWTVVRRVDQRPPRQIEQEPVIKQNINNGVWTIDEKGNKPGAKKIHRRKIADDDGDTSLSTPTTVQKSEIALKKKNLENYMVDLDTQYKEGLLMEETYQTLKGKSIDELKELESLLRQGGPKVKNEAKGKKS